MACIVCVFSLGHCPICSSETHPSIFGYVLLLSLVMVFLVLVLFCQGIFIHWSLCFHPLVKNTVYIWVPSPLTTASVLFICGTTCNSGKVYLVVSRAVYLHHYLFWGIPTVVLGTLQFFFSGQLKIAFNSSGVNFSTMTTQFILSCNRSLQNLTSCLTVNEKAKGPIWLLLITH